MREYYVPGLGEKDPDKITRSLMQAHENSAADADDIATNTANIAANTAKLTALGSPLTNALGADVNLNNTANYFDGPSVAQGTSGTWFASGTVTVNDASTVIFQAKLWDGTTVIASTTIVSLSTQTVANISLSGIITNPAGNIRISVRDVTTTAGKIFFNQTGNSKDSTITAVRLA